MISGGHLWINSIPYPVNSTNYDTHEEPGMTALVYKMVSYTDSTIDKTSLASEITSGLKAKQTRCTDQEHYMRALILKNSYLKIKLENIVRLISDVITSTFNIDPATFNYYNKCIAKELRSLTEEDLFHMYQDAYHQFQDEPLKIDQLELEYKFHSYYDTILKLLFEQNYEKIISTRQVAKSTGCSKRQLAEVLNAQLSKCSCTFSNTY